MSFVLAVVKVIIGAFLMFSLANKLLLVLATKKAIYWHIAVGVMAFLLMIGYSLIRHDINVPSFTVLLFGFTLAGLSTSKEPMPGILKGAVIAVAIGGCLGWLTFAKIGHVS